jgi:hypothetical protein
MNLTTAVLEFLPPLIENQIIEKLIALLFIIFLMNLIYSSHKSLKALKEKRISESLNIFQVFKDDNNDSQSGKIVLSIDPIEFLDDKAVTRITPIYVPTILTGLGILGTFAGISVGLQTFPENFSISDPTAMASGINGLIPAMKSAFSTSLMGIFSSTFILIIEKIYLALIAKKYQRVYDYVMLTYEERSPAHYMEGFNNSAFKMQEGLKDMSLSINNLNETSLGLGSYLSKMEAAASPKQLAIIIAEGLREVIASELAPVFVNIDAKLAILEDVKQVNIELKENNKALSEYIQNDLNEIFNKIQTVTETTNRSINSTIDAMEDTKESIKEQNSNVELLNNTMSKFLNDFNDSLKNYETRHVQFLGAIHDEMSEATKQLFDQLTISVTHTLESASKNIQVSVGEVEKTFRNTSDLVEQNLRNINEMFTESIQAYLEKQNEILDRLINENTREVAVVVKNFKETLGDDLETREKLLDRMVTITGNLGTYSATIQGTFLDITKQALDQGSAFTSMAKQITGSIASVDKSMLEISNILEEDFTVKLNEFSTKQSEIVSQFQKDTDKHIADILARISTAAFELIEASQVERN